MEILRKSYRPNEPTLVLHSLPSMHACTCVLPPEHTKHVSKSVRFFLPIILYTIETVC